MTTKAKPCPFCDSPRIGCHFRRSSRFKAGYQCMCLNCGVRQSGSFHPDPETAIGVWNQRGAITNNPPNDIVAATDHKGNAMSDLSKCTAEQLSARQKALEDEIESNEQENRLNQAELELIYAEQDRRKS